MADFLPAPFARRTRHPDRASGASRHRGTRPTGPLRFCRGVALPPGDGGRTCLTIHKRMLMNCHMQIASGAENKIFQALADPSRRAIFESLTRGEAAVKDLTARFDITQPAVSQHLAALKDAGLVNGRREGRCVYYRVEPRGMKPLIDWIAHYRAFWTEHVDRLERLLEKMDE